MTFPNTIDLHLHSTTSDGQYTPTELVTLCKKAGLSTIALTDHDTTAGIREAAAAAERLGIHLIPGIELDTKYPGIKGNFHILGYGIDITHPVLADCCSNFAAQRKERADRIFAYLKDYHVCPTRERVMKLAEGGVIGRPHFARAMVEEGLVENTREAFEKYLDTEEFAKIDRPKPHPKTAIQMIVAAGGIPVLAHPSQLKLGELSLETLLIELKSYGLKGLECCYHNHTPKQTEEYMDLAKKLDLCITAGSDFHGEKVKPTVKLGGFFVPEKFSNTAFLY